MATFPNGTKRFSDLKAGDRFSFATSSEDVLQALTDARHTQAKGKFIISYTRGQGMLKTTQTGATEVMIYSPVPVEPKPVQTPESKLIARCQLNVDKATLVLEKHIEHLRADPLGAMTWSRSVFQAAADFQVSRTILNALTLADTKATFDSIREHVGDEIARRSANAASMSTSPTSNLADLYVLVAWSEIADAMGRM